MKSSKAKRSPMKVKPDQPMPAVRVRKPKRGEVPPAEPEPEPEPASEAAEDPHPVFEPPAEPAAEE
tara:strand:- start:5220 stop:5417 length:198 start_codon:yes stop_codon:yes gene_type:complete